MAGIPALTVARAAALQTDAQRLREQQEEARARRDFERQQAIEARDREVARDRAADQRRLEAARDQQRVEQQNRRFFRAQEELRDIDLADQRFVLTEGQIRDEVFDARAFRAEEDAPPPAAPLGRDLAPIAAPGPQAPEAPDHSRESTFRSLEAARDARLAERREAERDADIQQRIDLRLAGDRIGTVAPNPELPRGSIVDVSG